MYPTHTKSIGIYIPFSLIETIQIIEIQLSRIGSVLLAI